MDAETGALLGEKKFSAVNAPDAASFDSSESRLVVFGSEGGTVLSLPSLQLLGTLRFGRSGWDNIISVGVRDDGRVFALSTYDGLYGWAPGTTGDPDVRDPLTGHGFSTVPRSGFSGKRYLLAQESLGVAQVLVDVESRKVVHTLHSSQFPAQDFSLSDDASTAYGAFYDRATVWETRTGRVLAEIAVTDDQGKRIPASAILPYPKSGVFFVTVDEGLIAYGARSDWKRICGER